LSVLGPPVAVMGMPVDPEPVRATTTAAAVVPASAEAPAPKPEGRAAKLGSPTNASRVSALPPADSGLRPAGGTDGVNEFLARRSGYPKDEVNPGKPAGPVPGRSSNKWGEKFEGWFGKRGEWFKGDHAFDGFISPVTNPFLFEDPRSVTELRPIFMYQKMPGAQPDFGGGNIYTYNLQGRVAVTERLSLVMHKLGGMTISPSSTTPFATSGSRTGFEEIWIGPKYTFIRDEQTCSLLAGGLQFQIPVGSANVYQNTGSLSLVPYVTYAQNFLKDTFYHGFNGMIGTGYSFSTTNARSDFWYLSGHIDTEIRVSESVRFYPLIESNYYLITTNGGERPQLGIEGQDLINFGGHAKGHGLWTGAIGARLKISECYQFGAAFEAPLAGPKDIMQYRFTLDFIWRY
jgi:hypothetical protein